MTPINAELRLRIKAVLHTITQDRQREAAWLNTLSRLEHIGARKISRTVAASHADRIILEHLSDEARHACVFKQLSEYMYPDAPYLQEAAAVDYFQSLDAHVSQHITRANGGQAHTFTNYAAVTMLIERRAMVIYPLYLSVTQDAHVQEKLAIVIREEAEHRNNIEQAALRALAKIKIVGVGPLEMLENELFSKFLCALEHASHPSTP